MTSVRVQEQPVWIADAEVADIKVELVLGQVDGHTFMPKLTASAQKAWHSECDCSRDGILVHECQPEDVVPQFARDVHQATVWMRSGWLRRREEHGVDRVDVLVACKLSAFFT